MTFRITYVGAVNIENFERVTTAVLGIVARAAVVAVGLVNSNKIRIEFAQTATLWALESKYHKLICFKVFDFKEDIHYLTKVDENE